MKVLSRAAVLILIFLSSACGYYFERLHEGPVTEPGLAKASVSFAGVKAAVFEPYCVRCHRQYESFGGVKPDVAAIATAVNSDRMPRGSGPLSTSEKKILNDWIAAGAPESERGGAPGVPLPLAPEWESLAQNIFFPRCTACHNPNGEAKFLDLSSRQALLAASNREFEGKKLIDVTLPGQSYLLTVVEDQEEPMPPVRSGFRRLDATEISTLKDWIALGLP